jgi:hypothetical protein
MKTYFINSAQAHAKETADQIAATLHIDPADHPIVNKEANFYFTFSDPSNTFALKNCDCSITVLKDTREIDKQSVKSSDGVLSSFGSQPLYTKTFSEVGQYNLHFNAAPKNGAQFKPFQLNYDVEVVSNGMSGTDHHAMATNQHFGHIIIFGGGLLAAIVLFIRNYKQENK